jgi:hypothetical protein
MSSSGTRVVPPILAKENSMNRKIVMAALAAFAVAASSAPALAQWGGPGFSVGVGFGDNGWNGGYGYYRRPGVGLSVGFGSPGWGYDDWNYGSYAAAPSYGCTCSNRYRTARVAPGYRYSYASYGYPYDYAYDDSYYGGSYASIGLGWNDDGWRRRTRGDVDRRFDRADRFRADVRMGDRGRQGGRINRERMAFSERTGGEARVRSSGEFRSGTSGEMRATRGNGGGPAARPGSNGGGATVGVGSNGGRRGGDGTR